MDLQLYIIKTDKVVLKKYLQTGFIAIVCISAITSCNQSSTKPDAAIVDNFKTYKMELNENKKLGKDFIEVIKTSNVNKLKSMITEGFSWWIIGKPEYLATAGEHDTEYFLRFFKRTALFPNGADFKTTSLISKGNKVVAEAEFKDKTAMGTDYDNSFHSLFIIEEGKVKRMKEYMDTYHAKVTFGL